MERIRKISHVTDIDNFLEKDKLGEYISNASF